MTSMNGAKRWLLAGIILAVVVSQFSGQFNRYYLGIIVDIGINIILAVSLNLINGHTGQFSLGHAGFMAVGGYSAAKFTLVVAPMVPESLQPLLFLVALILGGLLKLVGGFGVPTIQAFVAGQIANFDHLSAVLDRVQGVGDLGLLVGPLLRFAPVAVPALITALLVWLWLRALFGRVGSDAFVARLGARPARPDDFEERQLANIVEEVAIGAGAPVPQLFLIDSAQVKAAAVGTSHRKGVLLFTRGLLETLDRSETEA
ncbi:MAG TPA: hypothetical protein DCP71_01035, partial [Verrucomicrobiales bacterium]|nr:hypothetical protein [Verrucomicrobiales bacterium]